jgi:hypothetical protein
LSKKSKQQRTKIKAKRAECKSNTSTIGAIQVKNKLAKEPLLLSTAL